MLDATSRQYGAIATSASRMWWIAMVSTAIGRPGLTSKAPRSCSICQRPSEPSATSCQPISQTSFRPLPAVSRSITRTRGSLVRSVISRASLHHLISSYRTLLPIRGRDKPSLRGFGRQRSLVGISVPEGSPMLLHNRWSRVSTFLLRLNWAASVGLQLHRR